MSARLPTPRDEDDDVAARVASMLKVGAPLAVLLLAIGAGLLRGVPVAILVLAAGALAAVIALFWQSVRTLVGETPLSGADAFAIAAPRAEEEKKRAVLRALKDLEFERSVGKISAADYDELVLSYRAQAKTLLQQLDDHAKPKRDRVMALVEKRLRDAGLARHPHPGLAGGLEDQRAHAGPAASAATTELPVADEPIGPEEASEPASDPEPAPRSPEPEPELDPAEAKGDAAAAGEGGPSKTELGDAVATAPDAGAERATCAGCSASNEPDAAFCKKCGAKIAQPEVDADAS